MESNDGALTIAANEGTAGSSIIRLPARRGRLRVLAKQAMCACYLYAGGKQWRDYCRRQSGQQQIVILYYHRVGATDYVSCSAERFREDLRYLNRNFECLTLGDLMDRLEGGSPLAHPIAVITFDDGYRDNYTAALPILRETGVPATFFVSTGYMGTERVFPHDQRAFEKGMTRRADWPKLSWTELGEMQAAGMEIGSHTVEHANMARLTPAEMREEAELSLQQLNRELGERRRAFCFPWGTPRDFNDAACDAIRRAGYYAAVTTVAGEVSYSSPRYQLPRIDAGNGNFSSLAVAARAQGFGSARLARGLQ